MNGRVTITKGSCCADKPLEDGDRIALGEFVVEVIETIGHTQCSVSFLINNEVMVSSETIGLKGILKGICPGIPD